MTTQLVLARLLRRQTHEQKGPSAIDISQSIALEDSVLEGKLRNLEVHEEPGPGGEARPYKRRRLSKDSGAKRELVTQLTTEVFGLLGSQLAADLDGLSMVAR